MSGLILDPYRFGSFDPRTAIAWEAACWADDPAWSTGKPAEGGDVSAWRNFGSRAGAGDFVQGNGARQPNWSASSFAGKGGVTFNGSSDMLSTAAFSSALATPFSHVLIGKRTATGTGVEFWFGANLSALYAYNGTFNVFYNGWVYGPATNTTGHLFRGYATGGAASKIAVDESVTSGTAGATSAALAGFGVQSAGTAATASVVAFAGLYAGDITADGQWSAFKSWAASYYGLTIA